MHGIRKSGGRREGKNRMASLSLKRNNFFRERS